MTDAAPLPTTERGEPMPLAGVRAVARIEEAERDWRALQDACVHTPYQRLEFLAAWQRHVGTAAGIAPRIVIGDDATGKPAVLLPLGVGVRHGARIVAFLGGDHANYNLGLWREDVARQMSASALQPLIDAAIADADALWLDRQPFDWNGLGNPLRLVRHRPSPRHGWFAPLDTDPDRQLSRLMSRETRHKLRKKERKLAALPGYGYRRADTAADIDRALDAFLAHKAVRLPRAGYDNPFAMPGVAAFLRELAHQRRADGTPQMECHALACDAEVIAVNALFRDPARTTAMLLSITESENARWSPGAVLLSHVVDALCRAGVRAFDLGVGDADYKRWFCDQAEPLFDTRLARTALGHAVTAWDDGCACLRACATSLPWLRTLAHDLRRRLRGTA